MTSTTPNRIAPTAQNGIPLAEPGVLLVLLGSAFSSIVISLPSRGGSLRNTMMHLRGCSCRDLDCRYSNDSQETRWHGPIDADDDLVGIRGHASGKSGALVEHVGGRHL